MRNAAKDAQEMAARREAMLSTGFRLFAEQGIEPVTMQAVADACGVGVATLYRYYPTKLAFVIAIGTQQWVDYMAEVARRYEEANGPTMNAAEEYAFFLDSFLDLYAHRRDLLLFNHNFDAYVKHEGATAEQMRPYNESVDAFAHKFHVVYEKGLRDGTLRCDVSEQTLFVTSLYTMLAVAAKYADGLVYPADAPVDLTGELVRLRDILYAANVVG